MGVAEFCRVSLGEFTQDVVRVARSNGEIDFLKLQECRERALLRAKDAEGLGLPIEDEAYARGEPILRMTGVDGQHASAGFALP